MSKPSLILIGAGGHAHSCIDVIEQEGVYKIVGLIGQPSEVNSEYLGYAVIGTDTDLPQLAKNFDCALIALGQIQTPEHRMRLFQQASATGFQMVTVISPKAYVSKHATVGLGTVVMHGAIINAGAQIGSNCIINSNALIEHDTTVGDNCHISTGTLLNGNVTVGAGTFIGSRSVVKQGISIGQDCVVGMGLTVRHDLNACTTYKGHTAK